MGKKAQKRRVYEHIGDHLLDAQKCAIENPATFEAPSVAEINAIARGDFVKIHWLSDEGFDIRFWVTVVRKQNTKVWGVNDVNRQPNPLPPGKFLQFSTNHVCHWVQKPD